MNTAVFSKSLIDRRRSLTGWALGTALVGMAYASTYPSQKDSTAGLPEAFRDSLQVDATAAGYLQASVFGIVLPLLALVYGVTAGSRAIAADEESGQLDLLLAHPLTRTRLALQRFGALIVGAVAISALTWLALLAARDSAELTSITPVELLAQCLNLALLSIIFGALALGVGAAGGRRVMVLTVTSIIGVLAYTASTFAAQINMDWLAYFSPFHYYIGGEPLRHGFQWADVGVLSGASALLILAGIYRFNHRDLNS